MTELVDGHGWVLVRIDTQPDADGWCCCTPANHPDDVKRLGFPEWNETSQFHGKVENARRSSPDREMVERAAKAAVAELRVIAAELDTPFDYVKTISVGNFRVMRAALLAALEAKP